MSELPIKNLTCSCCSGPTSGRQWWGRDVGYGLCVWCIPEAAAHLSPADFRLCYGVHGVHFAIDKPLPEIHNRRGLGVLLWPSGELQAFQTYDEAAQVFDAVATEASG